MLLSLFESLSIHVAYGRVSDDPLWLSFLSSSMISARERWFDSIR